MARSVSDDIRSDLLDSGRGNVYLGATAPDIRVITRWDRSRTHFFDLNDFSEQSGVEAFFNENPALAEAGGVTAPTAAFVAGYATHLVMDELWINMVYRPYFGERSPLGGSLRANVMDRALQFSLDHERRGDSDLVAEVVDAVVRCDLGLDIGFIDAESLRKWHSVVVDMMNSEPSWERFSAGARRHLPESADTEEFEELIRSVPDLVDETVRYLTPELLDQFMAEAFHRCHQCVKEYVQCGY
jgi:hypothetical protein